MGHTAAPVVAGWAMRPILPRERRQKRVLMTQKCRGSIVAFSISKSDEPNEEQKVLITGFEQGFTVNTREQIV